MKRRIAVFDFDGTLTTQDSFLAFIKHTCGLGRYFAGLLLFTPMLMLMLLHLYPNWKAKERVFSYFFKGWRYDRFKALGQDFSDEIDKMRNEHVISRLQQHIANGDNVYVISASLPEWVEPWCKRLGVNAVLATEIEVNEKGIITGRFKTKNCFGPEKVNRLLEVEPDRDTYQLYAYGDSRGDKELIEFADFGTYVNTENWQQ